VSVIVGPGMDDAGHLGRCLAGIFYQDRSLRPPESPIVTISGKMRQYGAFLTCLMRMHNSSSPKEEPRGD
jgi:hypothetical protein